MKIAADRERAEQKVGVRVVYDIDADEAYGQLPREFGNHEAKRDEQQETDDEGPALAGALEPAAQLAQHCRAQERRATGRRTRSSTE